MLCPALALLLVMLPAAVLTPQETLPAEEALTVCLFDCVDLSAARLRTEELQGIIYDALDVALQHAGYRIVDPERTRTLWRETEEQYGRSEQDRLQGRYTVPVARDLGADIAVTGFFRIEDESRVLDEARILFAVKGYDVQTERFVAGRVSAGRGITLHNVINDAVSAIVPLLNQRRAASSTTEALEEEQGVALAEVILLSQDEGAEVYWAGEARAGSIVDGSLKLQAVQGTELVVESRKEGYHPRTQRFELTPEQSGFARLELKPLARESTWGSEFTHTVGQALGLGFGLRYYLKPDSLFLTAEDYFFLQKALGTSASPVFHNDLRVLLGRYVFLPPTAWFRLGISTGLGAVLSGDTMPETRLYTDFYLDFVNWWLEVNARTWIFFVRLEGRYMLGVGNNLLPAGWQSLPWGLPISMGFVRKWQ